MPNIKFPFMIQKRPTKILLDDISLKLPIIMPLPITNNLFDIGYLLTYGYSIPTVGHLTRFNNPDIVVGVLFTLVVD